MALTVVSLPGSSATGAGSSACPAELAGAWERSPGPGWVRLRLADFPCSCTPRPTHVVRSLGGAVGRTWKNPRKVRENKMKSEAACKLVGESREQLEKGKRTKE